MPHHPRAPHHSGHLLRPSMRVASVLEIDLAHLEELGVKGLIFDLDDTLVHAKQPRAEQEILDWIAGLRDRFEIYIVSNNASHARVHEAATHLNLRWVHRALKPSRRFFRHALEEMGLAPHQAAIVGDQLFTDVLGGNRLGAMTILVDPLSRERKWHRRVMRTVERSMLSGVAYHAPKTAHPARDPNGHAHHGHVHPKS